MIGDRKSGKSRTQSKATDTRKRNTEIEHTGRYAATEKIRMAIFNLFSKRGKKLPDVFTYDVPQSLRTQIRAIAPKNPVGKGLMKSGILC